MVKIVVFDGQHGTFPVITDELIMLGCCVFCVFPLTAKVNKTAADERCRYKPWLAVQYVLAVATIRLAKCAKLACD